MTDTSKYIRTGFFENVKGNDYVLISVDIQGLLEIEKAFLQLSKGSPLFDFSILKCLDQKYQVAIKAYNDTTNIGLKQIDKGRFEWRLTKIKWSQFREMATALFRIGKDGHQDLNTEADEEDLHSLQVVLSLDEYQLSFWKVHFSTCNG